MIGISLLCLLLLGVRSIQAGSATWNLNPTSGDWNTAANWTPATVPNGPDDIATFETSNTTDVSLSSFTDVDGITFNTGASGFTITAGAGAGLSFHRAGVTNNTGQTQRFVTATDQDGNAGFIVFSGSTTAGSETLFLNTASNVVGAFPGFIQFSENATAGEAMFVNKGSDSPDKLGAYIYFFGSATAGKGAFTGEGGTDVDAQGGTILFYETSSASEANFTLQGGGGGGITFFYDGTTADHAVFDVKGGGFAEQGGWVRFNGNATAANATLTFEGGTVSGAYSGGHTEFVDDSTAGNATLLITGGRDYAGASVQFQNQASAENATFTTEGGNDLNPNSRGQVAFEDNATAGDRRFVNNGATVSGAYGGQTWFFGKSTAGNATLVANGGVNGGRGGLIQFLDRSEGGTSRVQLFEDGRMDLVFHQPPRMVVGSIEGDGLLAVEDNNLRVGSNNLNTTFAGVIQDAGDGDGFGGSLAKIGTGTLTLSGANTYTGGTTVAEGILLVNSQQGSATGTGKVTVIGGVLGGNGVIGGRVGVEDGGSLSPGSNGIGALRLKHDLRFNVNATYACELNSTGGDADTVSARNVRIKSGASVSISDIDTSALPVGTMFTIIDNRGPNPISGTFSNLGEGTAVVVGANSYQVSYGGGDGNDLTLTVQ